MQIKVEHTRYGSEIEIRQYDYKGHIVEIKKGGSLNYISSKVIKDDVVLSICGYNNSTIENVKSEAFKYVDKLISYN